MDNRDFLDGIDEQLVRLNECLCNDQFLIWVDSATRRLLVSEAVKAGRPGVKAVFSGLPQFFKTGFTSRAWNSGTDNQGAA